MATIHDFVHYLLPPRYITANFGMSEIWIGD